MKGRGGSFGMIMLLVVMGIVLLLVAKNWQKIAPSAMPTGASHGEKEAAQEVESGQLPDLQQTREATDDHADAVSSALQEIE